MVLDSVARIVKVQLPAYLKQLPVPDSITGFARLTGNPSAAVPSLRAAPWGELWRARRGEGRGARPGHVTRGLCAPARRRRRRPPGKVPLRGDPAG